MMRCARPIFALLAMVVAVAASSDVAFAAKGNDPIVVLLERAHAHNDYEHDRPLLDALDHGFTSVEVDIFLVGDELLVAHDPEDVDASRTLQSLYLDPLTDRVEANGGSVYGDDTPFTLLIDVKTEAVSTYQALDRVLRRYKGLLTTVKSDNTKDKVRQGAVTAIVSGNRSRPTMEAQPVRYALHDGRLSDLGSGAPASLIPLISDRWTAHFTWMGDGSIPEQERQKLRDIVAQAHADGQRVRFWATPDTPGPMRDAIWRELIAADVDLINTDDLPGLQAFLLEHDPAVASASS